MPELVAFVKLISIYFCFIFGAVFGAYKGCNNSLQLAALRVCSEIQLTHTDGFTMSNYIVTLCTKPDTQKQITALRAAGLTVVKDSGGMYAADHTQYETKNGKRTGNTKTTRLFTAMPGRRGYLIRRVSNLFG